MPRVWHRHRPTLVSVTPEQIPPRRPANQSAPTSRRALYIALGTIVVVAIAVVMVLVVTGGGSDDTFDGPLVQVQPVEVSGDALPVPQAGVADNAVGLPVPRIDGKTFGSRSISVKGGDPLLVIVINRNDADVQGFVEDVVQWHHADLTPEDLSVVTVVTGPGRDTAADPVSSWFVREEWPWPFLIDDAAGTAAAALGVPSTPAVLLVDPDGVVRYRALGPIPSGQLAAEITAKLGL